MPRVRQNAVSIGCDPRLVTTTDTPPMRSHAEGPIVDRFPRRIGPS